MYPVKVGQFSSKQHWFFFQRNVILRVGEGEKPTDKETERQSDRETERQRDREAERQRDRETERQRDRETETERQRQTDRCINGLGLGEVAVWTVGWEGGGRGQLIACELHPGR